MKPLLRLKPYLQRYRKTLLIGLTTVIASNLFTVVQPLFLGRAVDDLKRGIESRNFDIVDILTWAGLIVAFALVAGFFTFMTRQTIIVVSRHIEFDLRNDLLSHLQTLPYSYYQNTPTGELMALATNDISAVRNVLGPGIMYPSDTLMTFTMVLTMMLLKDWQLTLLTLIPMPLVSYVVYRLGKVIHSKFMERQEQFSRLTTRAQENLSGIRVVKAYVREEHEATEFQTLSWDYLKKNLVLAKVQSILWPLMFVLIGFSMVITVYFGGLRVIDGRLSVGALTAFMSFLLMLIWPMIAFGWVINLLQQGAASMARLAAIFDTIPEIRNTERTDRTLKEIRGRIEFRDVSFTHKNSPRPALEHIDVTIDEGMTIAVVGYTGSGKTTLVNLIPRLYDVSKGEILIDGRPIREFPLEVLRRYVGYVPQETFLFSETIADNIRYGIDRETGDGVVEAASIAQMTREVQEFPRGFDTLVGERGITLSGGQKQRTSIARALLRSPRILILDDALASVDTYTEEEILRGLRAFMRGRTSIVISHRISTVKDADLIIVLDNGTIVERGTHDELVTQGGIYADLHRKQLLEQQLEAM